MTIIAGVDEAGFGPKLGPLVMSGAAFRVPDDRADECMWRMLRGTCVKKPTRKGRRLAVADSKVLYRDSLAPLERAALVMLAVRDFRPQTWYGLLAGIAPLAIEPLKSCAWYSADVGLPVDGEVGDVATKANAVRSDCQDQGVEFVGVFSEPLAEFSYNEIVARTRNKAAVNMGLALRVIDRILRSAPDIDVRIYVDRLGGRVHYREALGASFPEYDLQILHESVDQSAYRLLSPDRICTVEFSVGGEDRHFATALASVYSKYVRELYMRAFNSYWSAQLDGLRPTAGYYGDADRWLKDAAPLLQRLAIRKSMLVRQR